MSDAAPDPKAGLSVIAEAGQSGTAKGFDPEAFSVNLARAIESSGKALSAYLKPRENGEIKDQSAGELGEVVKTFSSVADYWLM